MQVFDYRYHYDYLMEQTLEASARNGGNRELGASPDGALILPEARNIVCHECADLVRCLHQAIGTSDVATWSANAWFML